MADDEVGAALTGRDPYDEFRRRKDIQDRQNERWPTAELRDAEGDPRQSLPQTLNPKAIEHLKAGARDLTRDVPVTPLGKQAGLQDIKRPSKDEVMQFLMQLDYMNTPQGIADYDREVGPVVDRYRTNFADRFQIPPETESTPKLAEGLLKHTKEARTRASAKGER